MPPTCFITLMNVSEAWAYGRSQLHPSPTARLDARLLLEHILKVGHGYLVSHGETPLTSAQEVEYRQLIRRAVQNEPIPYLVGRAPFYGLDFAVNPAVLIPRPETEQLVDLAIAWAGKRPSPRIVDVGTGSGCIPVLLARHLRQADIEATDVSAEALVVARQNAARLAPGRIRFHLGHLLEPIVESVDLITANLPYVTEAEWTMLDDGVKSYEPAVALIGGADGLDLIRQLLQQATEKLNPNGAILLEIGWGQGTAVRQLAQAAFPAAQVAVLPDIAGHDRIVAINLTIDD